MDGMGVVVLENVVNVCFVVFIIFFFFFIYLINCFLFIFLLIKNCKIIVVWFYMELYVEKMEVYWCMFLFLKMKFEDICTSDLGKK